MSSSLVEDINTFYMKAFQPDWISFNSVFDVSYDFCYIPFVYKSLF
jgi:hypothetical protein